MKKITKPKFIVDLTKAETYQDVLIEFAIAKTKAGVPITEDELNAIIKGSCDTMVDQLFRSNNAVLMEETGRIIPLTLRTLRKNDVEKQEIPAPTTEEVKEKKPGFFKRIWNKIAGK